MGFVGEVLDAWVHHYGWLWMLIGLLGWWVVVISSDN